MNVELACQEAKSCLIRVNPTKNWVFLETFATLFKQVIPIRETIEASVNSVSSCSKSRSAVQSESIRPKYGVACPETVERVCGASRLRASALKMPPFKVRKSGKSQSKSDNSPAKEEPLGNARNRLEPLKNTKSVLYAKIACFLWMPPCPDFYRGCSKSENPVQGFSDHHNTVQTNGLTPRNNR